MKDIARLAALDTSTVSRALKGDTRRVAPATIARVQALAADLGYIPDATASSLRGGKSRLIGVLVPSFSDVVIGQLVEAMENEMHKSGYLPLVIATEDDPTLRDRAVRVLLGRRVDGLILADSLVGHEVPDELETHSIPVVSAIRGVDNVLSVRADDVLGGRLVAEHFLESGHHHLALLNGSPHARTARDRAEGFLEATRAADIQVDVVQGQGFGLEAGYQTARKLIAQEKQFSAVFCTNDYNAIGCARALSEVGHKVGRDVALAGYNDIPLAGLLETPLTSVRTDISAIGANSVKILLNLIQGGTCTSEVLYPRLIVRASSQLSTNK